MAERVHIANRAFRPAGSLDVSQLSAPGGRMSQLDRYYTEHPRVRVFRPPQPSVAWPRRQHHLEAGLYACAVLLVIALIAAMMAPFP